MKKLILLFILFCNSVFSQAPEYTFSFNIDSVKTFEKAQKIEQQISSDLENDPIRTIFVKYPTYNLSTGKFECIIHFELSAEELEIVIGSYKRIEYKITNLEITNKYIQK